MFLFLNHTTKGQKPMDPVIVPTPGSAAVAVSEAADPLAWRRGAGQISVPLRHDVMLVLATF